MASLSASFVPRARLPGPPPPRPDAGPRPAPTLVCLASPDSAPAASRTGEEPSALELALAPLLRPAGGRLLVPGPRGPRDRAEPIARIPFSEAELAILRGGYPAQILRPLFHCRPFDGDDPDGWEQWARTSRRLAEALVTATVEGPAVAWVHELPMLLVPAFARSLAPGLPLGLLLETPFPPFALLRALPRRRTLLEAMLQADVVGLASRADVEAFVDSCRRLLGARQDRSGALEHQGRRTRVLAAAAGVDVERLVAVSESAAVEARVKRLRQARPGRRLVVAIDRLEPERGVRERLLAFERLLERFPAHRGRTTLVQLLAPSRTAAAHAYRQGLEEQAARLESRFGAGCVELVPRAPELEERVAWYRAADLLTVAPLHGGSDGMAKEFVAARIDLGGALVLGETTAAADELLQAYAVNPHAPDEVADALHAALEEDRGESERRISALRQRIRQHDVHAWAAEFLRALRPAGN